MAKKRSDGRLTATQQAAKFLGVSVLAGAVVAGIALPGVGLIGLSGKKTVQSFDELPADFTRPPLSQRTTILASDGSKIADVYSRNRTVVDLKDVSPWMRKALVDIEDSRFYQHGAVDLQGVLRALQRNASSGEVSQGASTLTQQYVKNVFIEEAGKNKAAVQHATRQTIGRKIRELKYAIQVEKELTKKQILENYLNITFFGEQAYGVEAAAQRYFSKHAADLDLDEAAMLAGLVQSPSRYDPINNPDEAKKRRNTVLYRMHQLHHITKQQEKEAQAEPLGLNVSSPEHGCITADNGAAFLCDYVEKVFKSDPVFGKTRKERQKRWDQGGLTIKTTLDPKAQKSVQDSIKSHVYSTDSVATAVSLVEPGTGKIVAMGQSRPFGYNTKKNETGVNLSVDNAMGGGNGFLSGSTFKPVVAAAALEEGVSPYKEYPSPYKMPYPSPVPTCDKQWLNNGGTTVENENESEVGPFRMKKATALSINTYYISLISDIGICPVVKTAEGMGIHRADGKDLQQLPSIALGTQPVTPLTMASAYATFANNGVHCTPVAIEAITDANGKSLKVPQSECERVMSEKTAKTVNSLLRGVVEDGTGTKAGLDDRDSAGKTGTTDNRWAAWFVGYTAKLAGAVWVGGPSHNVSMVDITIGGRYYPKVFGAGVPGPIWHDAMSGALAGVPAASLAVEPVKDKKPGEDKKDHGDDHGDGGDQGENGDSPWPDVSLPPDFIGGGANGGPGGHGHGHGGGGHKFP
jgi:membrane peptidoglycan carboxypeptidase